MAPLGIAVLLVFVFWPHGNQYSNTLTTALDDAAHGSVTPPPGTHPCESGQVVTITATPANGWYFDYWSGDVESDASAATTRVTINGRMTVTAHFAPYQYGIATYSVGSNPHDMAFDGANLWVLNSDNTVTKLSASDGTVVGTYSVGSSTAMVFDGVSIWLADSNTATVTRLNVSDGSVVATYSTGSVGGLNDIAFDGSNIWVTSQADCVMKLNASDGSVEGKYSVAVGNPGRIAFDGSGNVWVTCGANGVAKLDASDGDRKSVV